MATRSKPCFFSAAAALAELDAEARILAADEDLEDLTDVALTPGEEAEEEAQAQVGPLGEEVADLELDD